MVRHGRNFEEIIKAAYQPYLGRSWANRNNSTAWMPARLQKWWERKRLIGRVQKRAELFSERLRVYGLMNPQSILRIDGSESINSFVWVGGEPTKKLRREVRKAYDHLVEFETTGATIISN